jgi:hypothetical protein
VVAFAKGGALETVRGLNQRHPTGVFFAEQTVDGLWNALDELDENLKRFEPEKIRAHAASFGRERFKREISEALNESLKAARKRR